METSLYPGDLFATEFIAAEAATTDTEQQKLITNMHLKENEEIDTQLNTVSATNPEDPFENEKNFAEIIDSNFNSCLKVKNPENLGFAKFDIMDMPSYSGETNPEQPFDDEKVYAEIIDDNFNSSLKVEDSESLRCTDFNMPSFLKEGDTVDSQCIEDDMKQESVSATNRKESFEDEHIVAEVINGNFDYSVKYPDSFGCTDLRIISFPSSSGEANPEEPFVAELIGGNVDGSSRGNASESNGCAYLDIPATPSSTDLNNVLYKCSQCSYLTSHHDQYESHQSLYVCPYTHTQCNASFLCKSEFEQHLESAHLNFNFLNHFSASNVIRNLNRRGI